MSFRFTFDAAYYERFYLDPRTRVAGPLDVEVQARFLCAYLDYLGIRVRRVLDLGCGLGRLRDPLCEHFPGAVYTGVEVSEAPVRGARLGAWLGRHVPVRVRAPVRPRRLPGRASYLDDAEAEQAIGSFTRHCRGALFFGVLTREDWEENCDRARTDGNGYLREGSWYRRRLAPAFTCAGGGVFVARRAGVVTFELDRAE